MATYDYECAACGHVFEHVQSMTSPLLRKCPKCARLKLRRLISGGAGVIFKGSGFYETDYKRKNRGGESSEKRDSGESASESSKGSSEKSGSEKGPSEKSSSEKSSSEKSGDKGRPSGDAKTKSSSANEGAKKRD